ncbi:helix-turn-helix domain-containing protein [Methanonatronarchaeum sp. AMET-Sl]|uniref:helix-turn-helix domain-containing protein n=1 Tax=Methanonatronarchaeum sp. AMET-Sl TaxID=3037654 RepID=UPI00244DBAA4|nr:helix-turn-helix domain-containing protein [Methanonatronarchaeum sp. AMET-Sl]WGI18017.1 helix-turn-helix domain-containing protein [Methanonatronarchaeum sp. AMET-Sl]
MSKSRNKENKMNYNKLGWIKASTYRQNILRSLEAGPKTPKELAEENEYRMSHVSRTLSNLKEKGLVECLNPDCRKGRLYALTDEGKEMIKVI